MRIVNRTQFLALPAGTLYAKYQPCVFEDLCIKGDSLENDWFYQDIVGAISSHDSGDFTDKLERARVDGESLPMDFYCQGRDGCFDSEQLFWVFERQDVGALICRLHAALGESCPRS